MNGQREHLKLKSPKAVVVQQSLITNVGKGQS